MTLLPLPLHMANKMDKYAAVIGPWVWTEEWRQEEQPLDTDDAADEEGDGVAGEDDAEEKEQIQLEQFVME